MSSSLRSRLWWSYVLVTWLRLASWQLVLLILYHPKSIHLPAGQRPDDGRRSAPAQE